MAFTAHCDDCTLVNVAANNRIPVTVYRLWTIILTVGETKIESNRFIYHNQNQPICVINVYKIMQLYTTCQNMCIPKDIFSRMTICYWENFALRFYRRHLLSENCVSRDYFLIHINKFINFDFIHNFFNYFGKLRAEKKWSVYLQIYTELGKYLSISLICRTITREFFIIKIEKLTDYMSV